MGAGDPHGRVYQENGLIYAPLAVRPADHVGEHRGRGENAQAGTNAARFGPISNTTTTHKQQIRKTRQIGGFVLRGQQDHRQSQVRGLAAEHSGGNPRQYAA